MSARPGGSTAAAFHVHTSIGTQPETAAYALRRTGAAFSPVACTRGQLVGNSPERSRPRCTPTRAGGAFAVLDTPRAAVTLLARQGFEAPQWHQLLANAVPQPPDVEDIFLQRLFYDYRRVKRTNQPRKPKLRGTVTGTSTWHASPPGFSGGSSTSRQMRLGRRSPAVGPSGV